MMKMWNKLFFIFYDGEKSHVTSTTPVLHFRVTWLKLLWSMTTLAWHPAVTALVESTVTSRACFQFTALYDEVRVAHCSQNTQHSTQQPAHHTSGFNTGTHTQQVSSPIRFSTDVIFSYDMLCCKTFLLSLKLLKYEIEMVILCGYRCWAY